MNNSCSLLNETSLGVQKPRSHGHPYDSIQQSNIVKLFEPGISTSRGRCLKPSDMESMGPDVLFHCTCQLLTMEETSRRGVFPNVIDISHHSHYAVNKEALRSIPGLGRMLYTTLAVSVTAFASGTTEGWSSPMILILSSEENPINRVLTTSETNKMVTYMKLSSIVNTMLCGFLCDRFGRRSGAWAISFLVPLGWGLLATLSDISGLYVGAALIGSTTISGLVLGIIILSEMADDNVRGSLISIIVFWYSCGVLLAHVLGEICSFHVFNWVGFSISIISAILLYTLPESPQYLILKNRADDARRSLQWYHGSDPTVIEDRMNVRSIQMPFYSYDKMKSLDTQMRLSGEKKWIRLLTECILQEKLSGYDN
ncbi:unnamed protein product [Nesidiocoris tenuis]|uniref:Major facilitator superfamily (MFS) profile domain-containing protein n=1 Tax=Nesidiocoris tenuis TaxID=355587 RepID=A0A6H5G2W5_9HEMI|nr:unnamed protein product [Nesidiocoris tenuis]